MILDLGNVPMFSCETQLPTVHWLSSPIFPCSSFVCPASVTSPLISTIWGSSPYKPNIFCKVMFPARWHHHHILIWWSSYHHMQIIVSSHSTKYTTYAIFLERRGLKDIKYDTCASSVHHQCFISASSVHHQCIISASSAHHQCIISASSVYHQRIISAT